MADRHFSETLDTRSTQYLRKPPQVKHLVNPYNDAHFDKISKHLSTQTLDWKEFSFLKFHAGETELNYNRDVMQTVNSDPNGSFVAVLLDCVLISLGGESSNANTFELADILMRKYESNDYYLFHVKHTDTDNNAATNFQKLLNQLSICADYLGNLNNANVAPAFAKTIINEFYTKHIKMYSNNGKKDYDYYFRNKYILYNNEPNPKPESFVDFISKMVKNSAKGRHADKIRQKQFEVSVNRVIMNRLDVFEKYGGVICQVLEVCWEFIVKSNEDFDETTIKSKETKISSMVDKMLKLFENFELLTSNTINGVPTRENNPGKIHLVLAMITRYKLSDLLRQQLLSLDALSKHTEKSGLHFHIMFIPKTTKKKKFKDVDRKMNDPSVGDIQSEGLNLHPKVANDIGKTVENIDKEFSYRESDLQLAVPSSDDDIRVSKEDLFSERDYATGPVSVETELSNLFSSNVDIK